MTNEEKSDDEPDEPLFGNPTASNHAIHRGHVYASGNRRLSGLKASHQDPFIASHARLAARCEWNQPTSASSPNKVMTPSQFEHYRQQQELRRANSKVSHSDDSADSDYDEKDEVEKDREAERQRRKQEAHLAVYRQQMMKVTGQQSPEPSFRPEMGGANSSAPNLTVPSPNQGNNSGSGKSSEGDEDDEVPLGILAAHGFPNRNRPPTRLGSPSSMQNLRASTPAQMASPGARSVDNKQGNRTSLPVFARNLPRDPYFGASVVKPSNRESMALGRGSAMPGSPSTNAMPPGGLIGVIATEERARARRRGSANPQPQGPYDHQQELPGPSQYQYPSMSRDSLLPPGGQPGYAPAENTQMQLSQQMTQMMQTQMQWMQQMMQMQGMQGSPQPQMPNSFSSLPINAPMRPNSMPTSQNMNHVSREPRADQRTLSMLDPNASRWNGSRLSYDSPGDNRPGTPSRNGYAPSLAPSERSNVGMASRYRPVSVVPEQEHNTMPAPKPWNDENRRSPLSIPSQSTFQSEKTKSLGPTVTIRPVSSEGRQTLSGKKFDDEDDDDEGWAQMMEKREKKKSGWKMKRATTTLGDLMNAVH